MGELHLEMIRGRLGREFGVQVHLGKPQVAYKETLLQPAKGEGRYIRQTGGRGQYGQCKITVQPLERGKGFVFSDETKGGAIPKEFISSVRNGVREAMEVGILAGFPLIDVRVALTDGSWHEVDSTPLAFKIAGSLAFRDAAAAAKPVLLEPLMQLGVVPRAVYLGGIVGGLKARGGELEGLGMRC